VRVGVFLFGGVDMPDAGYVGPDGRPAPGDFVPTLED
jgi:hypothetical protein